MSGRAVCGAPSATSPSGTVLHCDRKPGHAGLHAWTSRAADEADGRPRTYRWGSSRRPRRRP